MPRIIQFVVLLGLALGAPATCCGQVQVPSQQTSGHLNPDHISRQSIQKDAPARSVASSSASAHTSVTATGILLVGECEEWPGEPTDERIKCPEGSSTWGLITATRQYAVFGKTSELKKYERQRVTVTGNVTPAVGNIPVDNLQVQSIAASSVDVQKIRQWIEQLRSNRWREPENLGNPTFWLFHFTPPMIHILLAGPAAQNLLLDYVNDPQIKDQVIFLLGGVGDGNAVEPIINAMESPNEAQKSAYARKVNLAANLALTNITISGVIWHHGGGITRDNCPNDPKSCWSAWWLRHRDTFDISNAYDRRYANYPDYGIYQYPGQYRSESFIQNAEK